MTAAVQHPQLAATWPAALGGGGQEGGVWDHHGFRLDLKLPAPKKIGSIRLSRETARCASQFMFFMSLSLCSVSILCRFVGGWGTEGWKCSSFLWPTKFWQISQGSLGAQIRFLLYFVCSCIWGGRGGAQCVFTPRTTRQHSAGFALHQRFSGRARRHVSPRIRAIGKGIAIKSRKRILRRGHGPEILPRNDSHAAWYISVPALCGMAAHLPSR